MTEIKVRMYRPNGIGDFFLLTFHQGGQTARMLIDCGVLKGTEDGAERMKLLMGKIRQASGGRLEVLAVTHEHWDHVSGFNQAREEFEQLHFDQVWLGWTEKKNDPRAQELAKKREKAQKALQAASLKLALSASPTARSRLAGLEALRQFWQFDERETTPPETSSGRDETSSPAQSGGGAKPEIGRRTTAQAMEWVRSGTGGEVKYLEPGGEPLTIPGVAGVRVFVLGPPLSAAAIRKSDPSQRAPEVYHLAEGMEMGFLAALERSQDNLEDPGSPFDASFRLPIPAAQELPFFQQRYFADQNWRDITLDWLGSAERLALQLDADTNNTSLVLAVELVRSGRVLLFPGDAQVGNWLSWQDVKWTFPDEQGKVTSLSGPDLLKRTVLYKVGHHASHNATLSEQGLEQMVSDQLTALVPVDEEQARQQGSQGWEMPFPPLLQRLAEKTSGRVFRADLGRPAGFPPRVEGEYEETEDFIELVYVD